MVRHPYSALYGCGWRTRKQLEKSGVKELLFDTITRTEGGTRITVQLCRIVKEEKKTINNLPPLFTHVYNPIKQRRPKNPNTKLHKFINGIYEKITGLVPA